MKPTDKKNPHAAILLVRTYRDVDTNKRWCKLQFEVDNETQDIIVERKSLEAVSTVEQLQDQGLSLSKTQIVKALADIAQIDAKGTQYVRMRCGRFGRNLITRAQSKDLQIVDRLKPVRRVPGQNKISFLRPKRKGDPDEFIEQISQLTVLSDELLLSYVVALAAPIGQFIDGQPGFVINFVGESSTGKSSALHVANSLTTKSMSDGDLESASDTLGRLLDMIPRMPGLVFVLSDVKTNRSPTFDKELLTFAMCVYEGKPRVGKGEDAEKATTVGYICILMSSEEPIDDRGQLASDLGGEYTRLIHVPVAPRSSGGIFERHPEKSAEYIKQLKTLLSEHYGKVMPLWFGVLKNDDIGRNQFFKSQERQLPDFFRGADGREQRVLDQLGFLYSVGMYAIENHFLCISHEQLQEAFERLCQRTIGFLQGNAQILTERKRKLAELLLDEDKVPVVRKGQKSEPKSGQIGFRNLVGATEYIFVLKERLEAEVRAGNVDDLKSEIRSICERSSDKNNPYRTRVKQLGWGPRQTSYKISAQKLRNVLAESKS